MKRISITAIALAIVISLVASAHTKLEGVYKLAGVPGQVTERAGKALVKRLPSGVEGVQMKGNKITAKPGYKFVKQDDGSVRIARMSGGGGLGIGGKWDCACDKDGSCSTVTDGSSLSCSAGSCKGKCTLYITTTRFKGGVIAY